MRILPTPTDIRRKKRLKRTKLTSKFAIFVGMSLVLLIAIGSPLVSKEIQIKRIKTDKEGFQMNESVEIDMGSYEPAELHVYLLRGEEKIEISAESITIENGTLSIKPSKDIKPGAYNLIIQDGTRVIYDNNFAWGVLAMNFNKSVYLPDEKANISIAVLDDQGNMVCDANLTLVAENVELGLTTTLSTGDDTITVNPDCYRHGYTLDPDFETEYGFEGIGSYDFTLTAVTQNGEYAITDQIEVRESVPFDVERLIATRIYPADKYPVNIVITANQDFSGVIQETIPAEFEITPPLHSTSYELIDEADSKKYITWQVNLTAGETINIGYYFKAPEISPQFYLLGTLKFYEIKDVVDNALDIEDIENNEDLYVEYETESSESTESSEYDNQQSFLIRNVYAEESTESGLSVDELEELMNFVPQSQIVEEEENVLSGTVIQEEFLVFEETRKWQLAIDVVAKMILLWDNASSIPTDWTCLSCGSGDFYNRFIRGSDAYGTSQGGNTSHTHSDPGTLTLVDSSDDLGSTGSSNTNKPPKQDHTHQIASPSVASGLSADNLPAYRTLRVIRYDFGIPATLPAGVIAYFVDSVPGGWTKVYNDGTTPRYARGADTVTTGGSNTHTHTLPLNNSAGPLGVQNVKGAASGTTVASSGHTHNSTSGSSNSGSSEPPYVNVTLAQKDSTGAVTTNMIAMFDNTPPAGNWTLKSDSGSTFYQRFPRPTDTSLDTTSDTSAHTHSNFTINSSTLTGGTGDGIVGSGGTAFSSTSHQHGITFSLDSQDHTPVYWDAIFAKATSAPSPNLEQIHYHWRNDSDNEANATSATSGTEDTSLNITSGSNKRLRIGVANEGGAAAEDVTFRLEYGAKSTTCGAIGTWVDVGADGDDWDMYNTTNLTDGNDTTDISNTIGGVTNTNPTFKTPNTGVKDASSQVGVLDLTIEDFTEMEFSVTAAGSVGDYCFRLTNAGSTTNITTTTYALASITNANTAPNTPTSLVQAKTDDTVLSTGDWTDETSVKFTATADDTDASDTLYLCVEKDDTDTAFSGTEDLCGNGVAYSGTPVSVSVTITSITDATQYHWQARVKDAANEYSSMQVYGANSDTTPGADRDFGVDTTAPTGGTVYDGTEAGVDKDFSTASLSQLSANWGSFNAAASGLQYYEYSIGTTQGGVDTKGWTNATTDTSVTATGLTLMTSKIYYFNVRATDNADNVQSAVSSDGQVVAPSLAFSVTPPSITFTNLGPGNSYTATNNATLTTSTNAYNGYVIRAYTTDLLKSIDLTDNIINFNGGSYAAPDEWLSGDRGFGYSTSDTSVQGSNIFNPPTCLGGGSSPCYAPFSQTAPGDIIADNTGTITGTPITAEEFTVNFKVQVNPTQATSDYSTTVVYTVTAQY